MEVLSKEDTLKAIEQATAPLLHKLEVQERILAKIPFQVSTLEASKLTGLSRHLLLKHFKPVKDGESGNLYFKVVDLERWIAERELKAA